MSRLVSVLAILGVLCACGTAQSGSAGATPSVQTSGVASIKALDVAGRSSAEPPAAVTVAPKPHKPPPPNYCAGNSIAQLVKVSIKSQHLWLCAKSRTVLSTPITSGAVDVPYDATPTGNFHIEGFYRDTVLTLNTGKQYHVKYWIPFISNVYGFHDASWQKFPYGSSKYKTQGSHGCIHMPLKAIAYLYKWARTGASVHIRA
jgi:hypothetical protein